MPATYQSRDDTERVGPFLGGWGGVVAVLLGIAVALALYPVISELVSWLHRAMVDLGASADGATMTLYWLGMVAIGAGFLVAFVGSDVRMDRLRGGIGDWSTLLRETLIALGVASLWLAAAATWDNFGDEFNTYEAGIELPAVGLLLLMIASAIVIGWIRRRRASEVQEPS